MATVTRYINTASTPGGDGTTNATAGANRAYASMSEWESAEQADLVTATDVHVVYCEGSADDTTQVIIDGWVTGASNTITIIGDHASATEDGTKYSLVTTAAAANDECFQTLEGYVTVNNIRISITNSGGYANYKGIVAINVPNCTFENIFIRASISNTSSTATGFDILNASATGCIVRNCIAVDFINGSEICRGYRGNVATTMQNSLAYNCYQGFSTTFGAVLATNCAAMSCTDGFDGSFDTSSNYNASNIASDAPGANSQNGTAATYDNAAGYDFHLASGDTVCRGNGTNLSGSFTTDIDGDTRSAWDIGPDEYVAAGGATPKNRTFHGPFGSPVFTGPF